MRNLYSETVKLTLALLLLAQILQAQVLNPGFISPVILRQGHTEQIRKAANGQIYVLGDFTHHGHARIGNLVRLNADGTLDTSFNVELPFGYVEDLEVLSNGNIVLINTNGYTGENKVVLLNPEGRTLSSVIMESPTALEAGPNGGFFLGDYDGTVRLYSSAFDNPDIVTTANERITDIKWNGTHVYIAGAFYGVYDTDGSWHERQKIARFHNNGALDQTFNPNSAMAEYISVPALFVQPDGKVVPLNSYQPNVYNVKPMRLNSDGTIDSGFVFPFPSDEFIEEAGFGNGKLFVTTRRRIVRFNTNGTVDTAFPQRRYRNSDPRTLVYPDGSLIIGNYPPATYGFAKFDAAGQRVNAYYGRLMRPGEVHSMDRSESSIFIGGDFIKVGNHFTRNVARLNPNGTVLTKFQALVIEPVLTVHAMAGAKVTFNTPYSVHRLKHDGTVDQTFSYATLPGSEDISKIILQRDGKILVGKGYRLYRLNPNGSRDYGFDSDAGVNATHSGHMAFDLDRNSGKIIYAAYYENVNHVYRYSIREFWRLNPDGSHDPSFTPPTLPSGYGGVLDVLSLDNHETIVSSDMSFTFNGMAKQVVKLNTDGSINEEFFNNYENDMYDRVQRAWRVGDRLMVGARYNPYDQSTAYRAFLLDGTPDNSIIIPGTLYTLNSFYGNNTELFVLGQVKVNEKQYQLTKLGINAPPSAGIAEAAAFEDEARISVYPNPVVKEVTFDVNERTSVSIFDQTGHVTSRFVVDNINNTITIDHLPRGRYVIELQQGDKIHRQHLIKQ